MKYFYIVIELKKGNVLNRFDMFHFTKKQHVDIVSVLEHAKKHSPDFDAYWIVSAIEIDESTYEEAVKKFAL